MGIRMLVLLALVCFAGARLVPAGVSLLACPHYPICDVLINPSTGRQAADPANYPNYTPLSYRYPAGINIAACPNFPFCAQNINPITGYQYA